MRRTLVVLAVTATLVLVWAGWVAGSAYVRGPKVAAELEGASPEGLLPSDLPRGRLCALLAVQDPTFFRHHGIGLFAGHIGHTTVTQALGKTLFFEAFDPGLLHLRKVRLMVAAWGFDHSVPKTTQLRLFLNHAYFGTFERREIRGFPAAAATFFGKSVQSLSDDEYLALVAMLISPNRYHVRLNPASNAARVRNIAR